MTLLRVRGLRVVYGAGDRRVAAVEGVDLDLQPGERLGLVGESGSGKTSLARAILRLLAGAEISGSVRLNGRELLDLPEEALRDVRGRDISIALQGSGSAFSPVHRMGPQMADPLRSHLGLSRSDAELRVLDAAARMHLPSALLERYPHQLSGGEKQRAMLAMAVATQPLVLIADEPTSGLDPITAAEVLDDLRAVQGEVAFGLIVASHNLVDIGRATDRTAVLYAGQIVEVGASDQVISAPRHPYSWGLMASHPALNRARDLRGIRGLPPDPTAPPAGCRFHPRCTQAVDLCAHEDPPLEMHDGRELACHLGGLVSAVRARSLVYTYGDGVAPAVDRVDIDLRHGEVLAIVGETGSGKTTVARLLVGHLQPTQGSVEFEGRRIDGAPAAELRALRRRLQLVFQDPFEAISARLTVLEAVREPLDVQHIGADRAERDALATAAIRAVRLPVTAAFLGARSHQLSGGQLQRVGIARALVLEPSVVIADEPVSMLDGSEQANLLNLLKELQVQRGLAMVLISHDITAACRLADRVAVMRDGAIVETGSAEAIVLRPRHPYTRRLVAAAQPSMGEGPDTGRPRDSEEV